ncbi:hypothetical protein OG242_02585 [Streptomyces sp. NBC_00727]|uniref:hypothetical protein n=1 Tax=Streptomyces sp. NBC_00727 TaxID=2903675 RepID=UPI003863D955
MTTKNQIIDEPWGPGSPRRASAAVHGYLSQLRKFLTAADGTPEGPVLLTRFATWVEEERPACLELSVERSEPGLEPCRSLRRLHQAILTSDRLLDLPVAS